MKSMFRRLSQSTIMRFLVVGGAAFLLDFGLLALLSQGLRWPLGISTAVAFLTSFFFSYTFQRVVFGSKSPYGPSLVKYLLLVALNTVASVVIVETINLSVLGWGGGKIVATTVTTTWNFFAYKYWVYAAPRGKPRQDFTL
ncbi:GtrA family protein [Glaciibacter superstes]|uniref:GtrA family protein n=1 Tax=Glaciibacter superstes TaxID=501023 RepID=UPI0003B3BC84|nr:GtrA family protein [Glaciibacter superstes]